jgi:hypothetical protein
LALSSISGVRQLGDVGLDPLPFSLRQRLIAPAACSAGK